MSKEINIVYDIDGVLNNLTEYIVNKYNMPMPNIYNINKCKNLSNKQKDLLMTCYNDAQIFRDITYNTSIKNLLDVEKSGIAKVYLHSLCYSKEIAEVKYSKIKEMLPEIKDENMIFDIGMNKTSLGFADIVIEDSFENILKYKGSTIKIILDKVYNKASIYNTTDWSYNIIRLKSLDQIIHTVNVIVSDKLEKLKNDIDTYEELIVSY